jgi:stearoyl-CoA desaturase (delta-9 desaturase)
METKSLPEAVPGLIPVSAKTNRLSFWVIHAVCLGAFWTGVSPVALAVCLGFYVLRMFAITGWYHRYFSHNAFKAGRKTRFAFAVLGCMAAQKGPLWWASHHREHHLFADTPRDPHSPAQVGFWRSHMLWFLEPGTFAVREERIRDLLRHPELRWLESRHWLAPLTAGIALLLLGTALRIYAPSLGTNGPQMLIWGFFISTVLLYHGTFSINSLGHLLGRPRYRTGDLSKNSAFLAFITLGEGWHNNHHHFPISARQGFYWWEVDLTYYALRSMAAIGLIWDLKPVPDRVRDGQRAGGGVNAVLKDVDSRKMDIKSGFCPHAPLEVILLPTR